MPSRAGRDKRKTILINVVLDKSGSMDCIRDATISSFNEFKNDQAREEGDAFMTLTFFDTHTYRFAEAAPVREMPDLTHEVYVPGGCTALYDAIGESMSVTDAFVDANHPDQVLFVIITDGAENSSREFDRDAIFTMIDQRQNEREYEFVFLGANQDSFIAGANIGIRDGRMLDFGHDEVATRSAVSRLNKNVKAYRRYGAKQVPEMFSDAFESMGADDGESLEKKRRDYEEQQRRKSS